MVVFFLVLALSLRLGSAVANLHEPLTGDALWYEDVGWSISQGGGDLRHRDFSHPPLYPLFLFFIYRLFGHSPLAVLGIQALLGTGSCWLTYLVGRRLLGVQIGLLSLAFCVLSVSLIKVSSLFLTESLLTFLLVFGTYLLLRLCEGSGWKVAVALGFVMGVASLTKSSVIFLPVLLVGGLLLLRSWSRPRRAGLSFTVLLAFSATLLPWSFRNLLHYGRWAPISTNAGITFYSSYRPPEGKLFGLITQDETTRYAASHFQSELDQSDFLFREAWRFIKENPGQLPRLELLKLGFLWVPLDWEIFGKRVFNVSYGFLLPFILWGMVVLLKRFRDFWILYLPIFYLHLVSLVFQGSPRYRLPFEPFLIVFSAAGVVHFLSLFCRKWIPSISLSLWLGAQWFLFVYSDVIRLQAKDLVTWLRLW